MATAGTFLVAQAEEHLGDPFDLNAQHAIIPLMPLALKCGWYCDRRDQQCGLPRPPHFHQLGAVSRRPIRGSLTLAKSLRRDMLSQQKMRVTVRNRLLGLALCIASPLFSSAAVAGAFYVSPAGNDSNSGSEAAPWRTIQKAANAAWPGDTVYIEAGTYAPFTIMKSGSAREGFVTFSAAPGDERRAVVDGRLNPSHQSGNCLYSRAQSYVAIKGLAITRCAKAGIWIEGNTAAAPSSNIHVSGNFISYTGSMAIAAAGRIFSSMIAEGEVRLADVIIEGNEITKTNEPSGRNEGISAGNGLRNALIRNNRLYDSRQYGIDCKIGCYNVKIYGNEISGFQKNAIYLDSRNHDVEVFGNYLHHNDDGIVLAREERGDMRRIRIYNNLIHDNEDYGILINKHQDDPGHSGWGAFDDVQIINNTIAWNGSSGIILPESWGNVPTDVLVSNNIVWSNGAGLKNGIGAAESDNLIEVDPLFVNEIDGPDLHLQLDSPAMDSGTAVDAPVDDFDRIPRPQGAGVDIGAYEFFGTRDEASDQPAAEDPTTCCDCSGAS